MQILRSSVFRNFAYLFANQFSNLIVPLLVFPYLVKTLGLSYYGIYSLAYAGVIFCFMFCDYGFNYSGAKYISINKDDVSKCDSAFSSIVSIKLLIAVVVSIFWILYTMLAPQFDGLLLFATLFIGMIIGNALNLQWFFQGIEQLGWYSAINSAFKLTSNVLILFLVKEPSDIYIIPILYSAAFLLSGICTLLIAKFRIGVNVKLFSGNGYRFFFEDGKDYFIVVAATSLVFNGTIITLGFFENDIFIIGVFATLDRVIKILVSIYIPYSGAIYPRNMVNFHNSEQKGLSMLYKYGAIALGFALICIAFIATFADVMLGFLDSKLVGYSIWMQLFSIWLFFIVLNNLIGYHYMNGVGKSGVFRNVSIIYSAITVTAMVVGCWLFSFKGCIIAVVSGEIFLTIMLLYKNPKLFVKPAF